MSTDQTHLIAVALILNAFWHFVNISFTIRLFDNDFHRVVSTVVFMFTLIAVTIVIAFGG
jgi:hypothetical protein